MSPKVNLNIHFNINLNFFHDLRPPLMFIQTM